MKNRTNALPTLPALPKNRTKALANCYCGCGEQTQSTFAPGHDGRLKGLILRVTRGRMTFEDVREWGGDGRLKGLERALKDAKLLERWNLTDEVNAWVEASKQEAAEAKAS